MSRGRTRHHGRPGIRTPSPQQVEKQAKGIQLRTLGLTYEEIAAELGCSPSWAHDTITAGLRFYLHQHGAEEEAAVSMKRMEVSARTCLAIILNDKKDPEVRLAAIRTLINVERRKASIVGFDAPKAINLRGEFTVITRDELSQRLAELEAELGAELGSGTGDAGRIIEARAVGMAETSETGS